MSSILIGFPLGSFRLEDILACSTLEAGLKVSGVVDDDRFEVVADVFDSAEVNVVVGNVLVVFIVVEVDALVGVTLVVGLIGVVFTVIDTTTGGFCKTSKY